MLIKAKASWRTMDYSVIEKLTSKDVDLSQSWNGAAKRAQGSPHAGLFLPERRLHWLDG